MRARELLLEYDRSQTVAKLGSALKKRFLNDNSLLAFDIRTKIIERIPEGTVDPSGFVIGCLLEYIEKTRSSQVYTVGYQPLYQRRDELLGRFLESRRLY